MSSSKSMASQHDWLFYALAVVGTILILAIAYLLFSGKCFEAFSNNVPTTYDAKLEYYYLPNCPHCKDFKPVWEQLSSTLKDEKLNIELIETELKADNDEDITGAPTVILKKGDKRHEMTKRTLQELVAEIKTVMDSTKASSPVSA